jgi:Domain of unknown function (DUF4926)
MRTPLASCLDGSGNDEMTLPFLATVRLVNDKYAAEGAHAGDIGVILEVWGDGNYEVEVSNPVTGETIAWFTAAEPDLELLDVPEVEPEHRSAD